MYQDDGLDEREPYFFAVKRDERLQISGMPICRLGWDDRIEGGSEGPFAQWEWDGCALDIRTDRYGMYPLYYWANDSAIAVSPSIPKLLELGGPADLDEVGLSVFLRLGFFIGEHTAFKAVRTVPAGATFRWENGRVQVAAAAHIPKAASIARGAAIDGYASLFKIAVQRRLSIDSDFVLPLSGGRDSRHILFELLEQGARPKACLTYRQLPPAYTWDVLAAVRLCGALNLPHRILDQPASRFTAEFRKNILTNFCADEHAQYLSLSEYVQGRFTLLYDGIGGDVLSNGSYLDEVRLRLFRDVRFRALADNLFADFPLHSPFHHERLLKDLLRPDQYRRFNRELAVESLCDEFRRHADAPNPVASFFFWNRTRREISLAPFRILGRGTRIVCPYLDHDVYDFLSSLPAEYFLGRTFHTETIRRAYPNHAHLPFDDEVQWSEEKWPNGYYRRFGRELLTYAVTRRSSRYLAYRYLLPRLMKCAVRDDYGKTLFSYRSFGNSALYWLQLEHLAENPSFFKKALEETPRLS